MSPRAGNRHEALSTLASIKNKDLFIYLKIGTALCAFEDSFRAAAAKKKADEKQVSKYQKSLNLLQGAHLAKAKVWDWLQWMVPAVS